MPKSIDHVNQLAAAVQADAGDDVLEAVHAVMHLFRARQYRALRERGEALTHMDGKVLGFFARHPGATQRELALHSGRDKGQLARLIAGLKDRGLLQGQADDADRRSVRLQLTATGRAVQQQLQGQRRRLAEAAVAGLSADERRALHALLERVRANLEAMP
ncbi:MAG: MarR family transcriptional regulator [Burkholderiaceae bacterium]|nr:MarR family transcriptional regulator [Burkholderiaceae bacterium]